MTRLPKSMKFPEGIVIKKGKWHDVFILEAIYNKDVYVLTVADARKKANKRVMIERLSGKRPLLRVKGDRFAVYLFHRAYKDKAEAEGYALGPHGAMPYR